MKIHHEQTIPRVGVNHLLDYFYSLYNRNASSVFDVTIEISDAVSIWTKARCYHWLQSKVQDRVNYLKTKYKWVKSGNSFFFRQGCFDSITYYPEERCAHVYYKWRAEWFRKSISDYLFIQELTGCETQLWHIPNLWIRRFELPVIVEWARSRGHQVHPTHERAYAAILKKYTLEETVRTSHSITRRYMLRYYLLHGKLSRERYLYHVHKMWADRAGNEEEWDKI